MEEKLKIKIEQVIGVLTQTEVLANQGCTSIVSKIASSQGVFLLKSSYKEKYRSWLQNEARILKMLDGEKVIPIPKYVSFFEEENGSHLVMSFEEGETLTTTLRKSNSIEEKQDLVKSFGQFLQNFHDAPRLQNLQKEGDWLQEQFAVAKTYAKNGQCDGSVELLHQLKEKKLKKVKQTMIHGDCTTDNVLVVNGEVRMFIDVSGMTEGDPRYDESLAVRKIIDRPELLAAFYEGYTRYKVSEEEFTFFHNGLYEFF